MENNLKKENLIFQYKFEILNEIIDVLRSLNYKAIQYIPYQHSFLAFVKEHENLLNFFTKKNHLLFYYSLFPKFYRIFLNKKQKICFDFCYLNKSIKQNDLKEVFSDNLIKRAISNSIFLEEDYSFKLTVSFLPFDNYIFLRETDKDYDDFYTDPEKTGHPEYDSRVWVGADSIIFGRLLKKYLKNKSFNRAIEIGSGTGILTIICSESAKSFEAIDYNQRAIEYTKLNVKINKIENIKTTYSNLFDKVEGKFDLILAAPWFVDLKKGGLEEVPYILEGLENYLLDDGICLMTLHSYVKNGQDPNLIFFKEFVKKTNYDVELYCMGYSIERDRLADWKKNKIDYYVDYFSVIKKKGSGSLKRHEVSIFRKIRDFTFIYLYRLFNKY